MANVRSIPGIWKFRRCGRMKGRSGAIRELRSRPSRTTYASWGTSGDLCPTGMREAGGRADGEGGGSEGGGRRNRNVSRRLGLSADYLPVPSALTTRSRAAVSAPLAASTPISACRAPEAADVFLALSALPPLPGTELTFLRNTLSDYRRIRNCRALAGMSRLIEINLHRGCIRGGKARPTRYPSGHVVILSPGGLAPDQFA